MGLDYDAALSLFRIGHFREIVRGSESTAANIAKLTRPEHRLLIARAILYTGDVELSRAIAIANGHLGASIHSRSEVILGLAAKRTGEFSDAVLHLQHAVHLAHSVQDHQQEAWAQLHLFRLLTEGEPPQVLIPMLRDIRRMAIRVGDAHLSAYLHDAVAVMEGQTGRFDEAKRHLATARSILERFPNAWLQGLTEVTESCMAYLEFDFAAASVHSTLSRRFGANAGHEFCFGALDTNEAHAHLISGRLQTAERNLQTVGKNATASVRFAAIDGLARLYLAANQLDKCDEVLRTIDDARRNPRVAASYSVRWTGVSRGRLLLRRRELAELEKHLDREIARARELNDSPLLSALTVLQAEAYLEQGHLSDAGRSLLLASEATVTSNPELRGSYQAACSRAVERATGKLAPLFSQRAERIWHHYGNVLARIEAASYGGPPLEIVDYDKDSRFARAPGGGPVSIDPDRAPAAVLDSITNAFDLASSPTLLGAELRQIIATLGCQSFASVGRLKRTAAGRDAVSPEHVIPLGKEGNETIALKYRAADDPEKSLLIADLARITRCALSLERLQREENERAAIWPSTDHGAGDAVFVDEQMVTLVAAARRVAPVNVSVLITGETGTGKEVLARAIHAASARANDVFMPFNCAACPRDVIDAQLFGHRRGAFTGAMEHAPGVIRAAAGGTLFLDEIGEAPLDVQPKLLRFLESGEIHPIGEARPVPVDVRVIAATNVDLDAAVSSGRFREDLFYRLNIVRLHMPPLRERRVEIPVLAQHYLRKYAGEFAKGDLRLAEETVEYLLLYRWPGNVRQLANEMRRLVAMAESDAVLMPEHLTPEIAASRRTVPPSDRPLDTNEVVVRIDQPMPAAVEHLERVMVAQALHACEGRIEETARRLGLSRKGLYLKRQRFGLDSSEQEHTRTA